MKVAIIGSRNSDVKNIGQYIPAEVTEVISGNARGIDTCAARYAISHGLTLTVFAPEYKKYGRCAPLKRNEQIVNHADIILAFWNGSSRGTKYVIEYAKKIGKNLVVFHVQ